MELQRFQKRPTIVLAIQWEGPWCDFPFVGREEIGIATKAFPSEVRFYVTTIHGQRAYLERDDWLIQEPDGKHYYPCKPEIFKSFYTAADNSDELSELRKRISDLESATCRVGSSDPPSECDY